MPGYMTGFQGAYDSAEKLRMAKEAQDHQMAMDLADQILRKRGMALNEEQLGLHRAQFAAEQDPNSPENRYRAAQTASVTQQTAQRPQELQGEMQQHQNAAAVSALSMGYSPEVARIVATEGWNSPNLPKSLLAMQMPQYQAAVKEQGQAARNVSYPNMAEFGGDMAFPGLGAILRQVVGEPSPRDVRLAEEGPPQAPTEQSVMAAPSPKYGAGREDAQAKREAEILRLQLQREKMQQQMQIEQEKSQRAAAHDQAMQESRAATQKALSDYRAEIVKLRNRGLDIQDKAVAAREKRAGNAEVIRAANKASQSAWKLTAMNKQLTTQLDEAKRQLASQSAIMNQPIDPAAMASPNYQQYLNAQAKAKALVPELTRQVKELTDQIEGNKAAILELNGDAMQHGGTASRASGLPDLGAQKRIMRQQGRAINRATDQGAALNAMRRALGLPVK